ncbi:unnamed protein product [Cercospora beticola]|nr:unnamed protein product [Cercospora beticola]
MAEENGSDKRDALELRDHLESLPQELYNTIYDLTFTADAKIRIYASKPAVEAEGLNYLVAKHFDHVVLNEPLPNTLWVDHNSRKKVAASFFRGESTFIFFGFDRDCFRILMGADGKRIERPLYAMLVGGTPFLPSSFYRTCAIVLDGIEDPFAEHLLYTSRGRVAELLEERSGSRNEGTYC